MTDFYGGYYPEPQMRLSDFLQQRNALAGDEYGDNYDAAPGTYSPPPPELRAYDPTWRDRLASLITGDERSAFRRLLAQRLLGTSGLGPSADPEQPWRALPVAAPMIDAAEAAYNDQHGRFALKALDTGVEAWGVGSLPNALARAAVRPPLPTAEPFHYPIMSKGAEVGYVSGNVRGDKMHISSAFRNSTDNRPFKHYANSVGYRDVREVFENIRRDFPHTARVTANRISGARKSGGASNNLDVEITPLWEQILNEAGRRGVR